LGIISDTNKTECGNWILADTDKNEGWGCGYLNIQTKLSVEAVENY
jgi:hypothetical protein